MSGPRPVFELTLSGRALARAQGSGSRGKATHVCSLRQHTREHSNGKVTRLWPQGPGQEPGAPGTRHRALPGKGPLCAPAILRFPGAGRCPWRGDVTGTPGTGLGSPRLRWGV